MTNQELLDKAKEIQELVLTLVEALEEKVKEDGEGGEEIKDDE